MAHWYGHLRLRISGLGAPQQAHPVDTMQVNYAIEYIAELLQLGELQVKSTQPAAVTVRELVTWGPDNASW